MTCKKLLRTLLTTVLAVWYVFITQTVAMATPTTSDYDAPIFDEFIDGVASSTGWDEKITYYLSAVDENSDPLKNDGAGRFFSEEDYFIKFWFELDEECDDCVEEISLLLRGDLFQELVFLESIDSTISEKILPITLTSGETKFLLNGVLDLDLVDCDFPITKTSITVTTVPEPATMLFLGFGLLGLAGIGRKRTKK